MIVTRTIAADAPTLLALISDPRGQWRLVAGVSPLLRPHANVDTSRCPRLVPVRVQLGRRDVLQITWILTPGRGTTEVDLAAQLLWRGVLARVLFVLGGRRWLRRHLERTIGTLATLAHGAAEDLEDVEREAEFRGVFRPAASG